MVEEINRFTQGPIDGDCPRYQTRQYLHPVYSLLEVTVDECEDVGGDLEARLTGGSSAVIREYIEPTPRRGGVLVA